MADEINKTGECLCGAVKFEVSFDAPKYNICHCSMCRKWSAGPFMSVHCSGKIGYTEQSGLAWYRASKWAERGFCSKCGTSLFWRFAEDHDAMLIVSVEALDDVSELKLEQHIYTDAQPDRYQFADDAPRLTEAEFLASLGVSEST